jgi:hypothetical protein
VQLRLCGCETVGPQIRSHQEADSSGAPGPTIHGWRPISATNMGTLGTVCCSSTLHQVLLRAASSGVRQLAIVELTVVWAADWGRANTIRPAGPNENRGQCTERYAQAQAHPREQLRR